jgi:hypothetical protein
MYVRLVLDHAQAQLVVQTMKPRLSALLADRFVPAAPSLHGVAMRLKGAHAAAFF